MQKTSIAISLLAVAVAFPALAETFDVPARKAGGSVPRLSGMSRLPGLSGVAGTPLSGSARTKMTPGGGSKSRTGTERRASSMYESQMGKATWPPVASWPMGLKSSRPTQTPHSNSGTKPKNQASR